MTTPMTRDELVKLMIANDAFLGELPDVQSHTILQAALRALEAAGCQIVQGEPEYWHYQRGPTEGRIRIYRDPHLVDTGWTETPLYAGKVQP